MNIPSIVLNTCGLKGNRWIVLNPISEKTFTLKLLKTLEDTSRYVNENKLNSSFIVTKIIPSKTRNAFVLQKKIRDLLNISKAAYLVIDTKNPNLLTIKEIDNLGQ